MHRQDSFAMQDESEEDEDENLHLSGKSESEEEEYESFFLQPASCPYNIKEKILEANAQLQQESYNEGKSVKVQFRSDLVDYEPDLTDDDVQSIESYTEEIINVNEELKYVLDTKLCNIMEEEIIEESIFETIIELNHQKQCQEEADEEIGYSPDEQSEDIEEIVEEFEEIKEIEEIEETEEISEFKDENCEDNIDFIIECPELPDEIPTPSEMFQSVSKCQETSTESELNNSQKKTKIKPKRRKPSEIDCRKHCIQELDSRLDLCIRNLNLNQRINKPVCPTLRLHRQKCCSQGCKIEQKLPIYTGVHSEYGLSSTQIARLARHKESTKCKAEKERELSDAYQQRKIQQNEIIFRQWLKDIAIRRNVERAREKEIISRTDSGIARTSRSGKNYSSSSSGESTQRTTTSTTRIGSRERREKLEQLEKRREKQQKASKARPKTANCITSLQLSIVDDDKGKTLRRRSRPHTTSSATARIYIEIPERLLESGFSLGELFIKQLNFTNSNKKERLDIVTKKPK